MKSKTNALNLVQNTIRVYRSIFVKLLFSQLFVFPAMHVSGQSRIFGTLTAADSKPLVNANVLLLNAKDSALVKGKITNEKGAYVFENILAGNYLLGYTHSGLKTIYSKNIAVGNKADEINMGNEVLDERQQELKEVTVTAKKPLYEQKIDRM